jgi:very-short-patch-repair endonuclease
MDFRRAHESTPTIISAAQRLRQELTPTEKILWDALKKRQLKGWKFRCQHPIDSFIADFYCPQHRLIVELDGEIHDQQAEYDEARTEQLNHLGCRVIRFRNQEVMTNLESVLQQITHTIESSP